MSAELRTAVDASVGWYEDLCTLHGVGSILADGVWSALDSPPPLHSDAVVVEPDVTAERVLDRLAGRERCGVKDSFATMDLSGAGMDLLFSATWIHRAARPSRQRDDRGAAQLALADRVDSRRRPQLRQQPPARRQGDVTPTGWAAVTTASELAAWTAQHDTSEVLLPPLLRRGHFRILAKHAGDHIVGGAVARLGSGAVDVSNVYAVPGQPIDWAELADVVHTYFPGRPLVGYERGDALAAALDGGFTPVGELRVWTR